jgi:hypothetical protein
MSFGLSHASIRTTSGERTTRIESIESNESPAATSSAVDARASSSFTLSLGACADDSNHARTHARAVSLAFCAPLVVDPVVVVVVCRRRRRRRMSSSYVVVVVVGWRSGLD